MRKLLSLLLFVLAAQPLFACTADLFEIRPARPTSFDRIEVVLRGNCPTGCIPWGPRVRVAGNTVTIESETKAACILIAQPWGERVDVGPLPGGTYTLVVRHDGKEVARRELVVREHPFAVKPSVAFDGMKVFLDAPDGEVVKVTIGGVEAEFDEKSIGDGVIATVPRLGPGLADVVITNRDGSTLTASQALLIPQPQADLSLEHERVFYPSVFTGPGAHGSEWNTNNFVRNRGPMELWTIPYLGQNILPIFVPAPLPVGTRTPVDNEQRDGGLLVLVPAGTESWLSYSSHIVDESRRRTDAGTELPVVHEREAAPRIELLNVPLTSESRQTLRIFDFDAVDGRQVRVQVDIDGRQPVVLNATLTHTIVCVTTPCYPRHPTYAVINLDADDRLRGAGPADITIYARTNDAPLWAYVSVTNNDTQHVTTNTPQHRRLTER
jgi:hypothetical protein